MNKINPAVSTLRIIGGQHRSRLISFFDTNLIRPSPNRVRETLFNWLQVDIVGANCLDAFAGSGILAFEALSRGAKTVIAIEKEMRFAGLITQNADKLQLNADAMKVVTQDFFNVVESLAGQQFDIIFLDPPFKHDFLAKALVAIQEHALLAPRGIIYFEVEKELALLQLPLQVEIVKEKVAGQVRYGLLRII